MRVDWVARAVHGAPPLAAKGARRVCRSRCSPCPGTRALADPGPPSSHSPLFGQKHVSVHIEVTGGAGGVLGWSSNEQVS